MATRPLVLATGNPGKLREFRALLANLPFELHSLAELGIVPPEESGATFLENAMLKARNASAAAAAPGTGDAANNAKLIAALAGVPAERRRARYRCALVLLLGEADAAPLIAEGVWEGSILDSPRGAGGFGYDPFFFLADRRRTAAELDPEEKNRLSHRGIALRALREQLLIREQSSAGGRPQ